MNDTSIRRNEEIDSPSSHLLRFDNTAPLMLDNGTSLTPWQLAYQSYGRLNADKSNAILVCHALTGDQHVANRHPITDKPGWWELMVGAGRPVDTDKYFVLCANVLGGCMGTSGAASTNPESGAPYGLDFPIVTIADMVRAQVRLIDYLGIEKLFAVIGGSMGGMQVLEWGACYPDRVFSAVPIATASRHTSQNIAFHEVGRQAIMADPNWREGKYFTHNTHPAKGLSVARMAAHVTYLSELALQQKFDRRLQDRDSLTYGFDADFQVENYLRYQGMTFVDRFDANSYLYLTRAMDYFDLAAKAEGVLARVFQNSMTRFCVVSFSSDWLFPTSESREVVHALNAAAASVSFVEVNSPRGHDAFLLDEPELFRTVEGFLSAGRRILGMD